MADEYFLKKLVFTRYGKNLRLYPFSFVELRDSNHNIVGSGFSPDNEMVVRYDPVVTDLEGVAQISPDSVIDPDFLKTNELATGVMYNRFQW